MKYIKPKRIVTSSGIENSKVLLSDKPLLHSFRYDDCAIINQGGYIILDFGMEMYGGIAIANQRISIHPKCAHVRVTFGESVSEAMSNIGEKNSGNHHSMRDTTLEMSMRSL